MLFDNITVRLLGSDDFPIEAKRAAARDLSEAAAAGALTVRTSSPLTLDRTAEAHSRVDAGSRSRVLVDVEGT
jgi:NADPH2:quinone reductase